MVNGEDRVNFSLLLSLSRSMMYQVHSVGKKKLIIVSCLSTGSKLSEGEKEKTIRYFLFSLSRVYWWRYYFIFTRSVRLNIIPLYNHLPKRDISKMRKIRFRYIKENGKSTSVTVRCSLKRKLISFIFDFLFLSIIKSDVDKSNCPSG
jgi:hypothetical protein